MRKPAARLSASCIFHFRSRQRDTSGPVFGYACWLPRHIKKFHPRGTHFPGLIALCPHARSQFVPVKSVFKNERCETLQPAGGVLTVWGQSVNISSLIINQPVQISTFPLALSSRLCFYGWSVWFVIIRLYLELFFYELFNALPEMKATFFVVLIMLSRPKEVYNKCRFAGWLTMGKLLLAEIIKVTFNH